jgi:U6 snRNA-associated Sm-like protein LSm8
MVVTSDGRILIGKFVGHDQVQNIILSDSHERVYSEDVNVECVPTGLYVVRGDTVCLIGEFDETKLDDNVRFAIPLPPIQQQSI